MKLRTIGCILASLEYTIAVIAITLGVSYCYLALPSLWTMGIMLLVAAALAAYAAWAGTWILRSARQQEKEESDGR